MTPKNFSVLANFCILLALTACAEGPNLREGQYWQRISPSEAIYQQGPKAEQMLDRDIGRCVVGLHELRSLGVVKDPVKTDSKGRVLDPDELQARDQKIPAPDSPLIPTDRTYIDFDGCMKSKGWERVIHMPHPIMPAKGGVYPDDQSKQDRSDVGEDGK